MNNTITRRSDASGEAIAYENRVKSLMKRIMLPKRPNGEIYTTSRDIAKVFGKSHQHVMEAIRNLAIPKQFSRSNFRQSTYKNSRGKTYPEYHITEKGFNLLVMGFTGKEAALYKVAFVEAFDAMQKHLFEKKQDWIYQLQESVAEERRLLMDNVIPEDKWQEDCMAASGNIKGKSMRQMQQERFTRAREEEAEA